MCWIFSVYVKNSLPAFLAPDHDLATTQASFPFPSSVQEDRLQGYKVTACLTKRDDNLDMKGLEFISLSLDT